MRGAQAQWDKITVPMFTVGNWSGMALHLRGNTEAFMRAASKHKKLRIHAGTHVHPFYTEEGRRDQLRFFDYWLKGIDNGVMDEPPVKLAIRKGRDEIEWRHEHEWPLARTQWTKLYFDLSAAGGRDAARMRRGSSPTNPAATGVAHLSRDQPRLDGLDLGRVLAGDGRRHQARHGRCRSRRRRSPQDIEVTGPLAASFWVSSATEDMDLFLTLRNFDADGNEVLETGQQGTPVPVAKGWLRASHRELDPELSLPYRPYHKHTRRLYLKPGEIVQVEVEIWPTSMVFKKGHRIRLDVQPRDGVGSQSYMHYHADYNTGTNTIYAGGEQRVLSAAAGHSGRQVSGRQPMSRPRPGGGYESHEPMRPRRPPRNARRATRCAARTGTLLARKDVLAGLLFMGVAAFGLWISRDYPIGTALRMGTGYVPRLLCWILLGLGAYPGAGAARSAAARRLAAAGARPGGRSCSSPLALVAFGLDASSGSGSSSRSCC